MKNFTENHIVTNSIAAAMALLLIAPATSLGSVHMNRGGSAPGRTASASARTPRTATTSRVAPRTPAMSSNNGSARGKSSFATPNASNRSSAGKSTSARRVDPRPPTSNGKSTSARRVDPRPPTSNGGHSRTIIDRFPKGHDRHTRGGGEFVERSRFRSHGHEFVERGYFHHGREFRHFYRPFLFGGTEFAAYMPDRFFARGFYAWAYNPWTVPVHYRWDWSSAPWFRFYSSYFTPYPVYSSASLWLTDYTIASSLQEAYPQAVATTCMTCAGYRVGLTPAVKGLLAVEIRRQIALESAEANGTVATAAPAFLDGNSHVFLASTSMTVDAGGQQCSLNPGDVVQLSGPAAINGAGATLQVLASQGQDCGLGSYVSLPLDQLQEMQNSLRATIDQGFAELRNRNGQGGLPVAPVAALAAPVTALAANGCPCNGAE